MNEQQIWKFSLQLKDTQVISMPYRAKMLCVQMQNGIPCLWALCEMDKAYGVADRTIDIFGTGHPITDLLTRTYIGTVTIGLLVWHVFERHT